MDAKLIAQILGAPAPNVAAAWPLLRAALAEQGLDSPLVRVGAAATVAVECAGWRPIAERRAKPGTRIWQLQERYWSTGCYGRGLIQLTHPKNYRAAGAALGIDLVGNPDLALELETACRIFGWFFASSGAGRACLARNWRLCRRRVNGPGLVHLEKFEGHVARLLEVC